jgi:metalloprotein, YbeY/UPF0054 family
MARDPSPRGEEDLFPVLGVISQVLDKNFSAQEITLVLSDDEEVRSLNKTFRGQDKPTNVLSFPSDEGKSLGDIILAYETVCREAKEGNIPLVHHTLHLIIHGFLHLLGYDHEKDEEALQMESLEVQILEALHIPNPYEDQ